MSFTGTCISLIVNRRDCYFTTEDTYDKERFSLILEITVQRSTDFKQQRRRFNNRFICLEADAILIQWNRIGSALLKIIKSCS